MCRLSPKPTTRDARESVIRHHPDVIVVGLLIYALLGIVTDLMVRLLERYALRWQDGPAR